MKLEEIAEEMKAAQTEIDDGASYPDGGPYDLAHLAERILAAHEREMDALARQKTEEAHEAFMRNAELADAILEKDAERLTVSSNYEAVIAAKDRIIAAKDTEIKMLRSLLGELADVAVRFVACKATECETLCGVGVKCIHKKTIELVAKAREVVK